MEKIESHLKGRYRVFFDSAPLIYYFEDHPHYAPVVDRVLQLIDRGEITGCTSVVTLIELLTKPLKEHNELLAEEYERVLIGARGFRVLDVTAKIGAMAARLRARYGLKTPDAIQIAVAIASKCDDHK